MLGMDTTDRAEQLAVVDSGPWIGEIRAKVRVAASITQRRNSGRVIMIKLKKVLYTAKTRTTGGRDGDSHSNDGRLEVKLSTPGTSGAGTNPEQLFAAGWSASLITAMKISAGRMRVTLPANLFVDAEVDLATTRDFAYGLAARFNISLPGMEPEMVQNVVHAALKICPYTRVAGSNIDVIINVA
jgi:osmotically inducible protein OsmC